MSSLRRNPVRSCRQESHPISPDFSREPSPEPVRQPAPQPAPRPALQPAPQRRQRRSLPFLLLPLLAQENILNHVHPTDFVQFALISKRAREIAKAVKFTRIMEVDGILPLGKIYVKFTEDFVSIRVQARYPTGTVRLEVSKGTRRRANVLNPELFTREKIWSHGELLRSSLVATFPRSQIHEAARIMIEYICSLFCIPVGRVSVNVDDIPKFSNLFIWDLLRGSCPDVQFHGTAVQDDQVNKFFKKFEVQERFALEVDNIGNMEANFDKIKHCDLLVLKNARWMQDHHFEQLNCEYLEVRDTKVTPQAINRWFKKWMNSSDTHTKVLVISYERVVRYNFFHILNGIAYHSFSEFKEEQTGTFGSFTRSYYEEPSSGGCMIPNRHVATVTRADGAVAKLGQDRTELCVYMTYP